VRSTDQIQVRISPVNQIVAEIAGDAVIRSPRLFVAKLELQTCSYDEGLAIVVAEVDSAITGNRR
jgi:hypothetical protein